VNGWVARRQEEQGDPTCDSAPDPQRCVNAWVSAQQRRRGALSSCATAVPETVQKCVNSWVNQQIRLAASKRASAAAATRVADAAAADADAAAAAGAAAPRAPEVEFFAASAPVPEAQAAAAVEAVEVSREVPAEFGVDLEEGAVTFGAEEWES
jgi:hypothetical protein